MAAPIVPTAVTVYFEVVELGSRYAYAELVFAETVTLTGIPGFELVDDDGVSHKPRGASPHVTDPLLLVSFVRLRYQAVPNFGGYNVVVLADDPHVVGASGGMVDAGSYAASVVG